MIITVSKNKNNMIFNLIDYISFILVFISIINLYYVHSRLAGILLMMYGIVRFIITLIWTKDVLNIKGLFLLIWSCTLGLGMLRLLGYQREWSLSFLYVTATGMLLCIWGIDIGNQLRFLHNKKSVVHLPKTIKLSKYQGKKIYYLVLVTTFISTLCHIISYAKTGIIPLFATSMYAYINVYTRFMLFEVAMIPSAALAFFCIKQVPLSKSKQYMMYLCMVIHILVLPILNVNRGVMVSGLMLIAPMVYYFCENRKKTVFYGMLLCLAAVLFISSKRNFSDEYLKKTFVVEKDTIAGKEFELTGMQAFIYGYFTISHDNFDYNIELLENYSNGGRIFAPFNKILRISKLNELVQNSTLYNITPGLNTHNLMSYLFYDFGTMGVILGMSIWGILWGSIESYFKNGGSVTSGGVFGGVMICIILGFFSCWMANFTLWMWWGTLFLFWLVIRRWKL